MRCTRDSPRSESARLTLRRHSRGPELAASNARSWAGYALKLALSLGILVACVTLLDVSALPEVIGRTSPGWFLLAACLTVAGTIVLPAMITKRALGIERLQFTLKDLVLINLAVRFYVLVLPRAISAGIRWLRYRAGGSGHDALALMVYERLVQLFTMMAVALVLLLVEMPVLGPVAIPIAGVVAVAVLLLALALAPFLFPATTPLLETLSATLGRIAPVFVATRAERLLDAVRAFQQLPAGARGYVGTLSLASYALFVLAPYLLAVSMQIDISWVALAWIRPIVFLTTLVPFTIGGLGIREAGFIGFLYLYGLSNHEALALSLGVFSIQVAIGIVGACVELWRHAASVAGRA